MRFVEPIEDRESTLARHNKCDFIIPDELEAFFIILSGRMRDALSPHASRWRPTPLFNSQAYENREAERRWLLTAVDLLALLANQHRVEFAPFDWFVRLIRGEVTYDGDKAQGVADATAELYRSLFDQNFPYKRDYAPAEQPAADDSNTAPSTAFLSEQFREIHDKLDALRPPASDRLTSDGEGECNLATTTSFMDLRKSLGCSRSALQNYCKKVGVPARANRAHRFSADERRKIITYLATGGTSDSSIAGKALNLLKTEKEQLSPN